jgi:VWFA-related protein
MNFRNLIAIPFMLLSPMCFAQIHEDVTVALVQVDVSALNSKGEPVLDLTKDDFVLKENGKEQPVTNFSRLLDPESETPLTILFLVDTSGSMKEGMDKMRRIDVARKFASLALKEVKHGDAMQVFAFDVFFRALTPMTSDPAIIDHALSSVEIDPKTNPGTALRWSLDLTIKELQSYQGRKIVILCSDGEDNAPTGPESIHAGVCARSISRTRMAKN